MSSVRTPDGTGKEQKRKKPIRILKRGISEHVSDRVLSSSKSSERWTPSGSLTLRGLVFNCSRLFCARSTLMTYDYCAKRKYCLEKIQERTAKRPRDECYFYFWKTRPGRINGEGGRRGGWTCRVRLKFESDLVLREPTM